MPKSKILKNKDCRGEPRYYIKKGDDTIIIHGLSRYWRRADGMVDFESGPALFVGSDIYDGKKNLGSIKDLSILHHETSDINKLADRLVKIIKEECNVVHANKELTLKMNVMSALSSFLSDWVMVEVKLEKKDGADQK
jgi:hypothetical protein